MKILFEGKVGVFLTLFLIAVMLLIWFDYFDTDFSYHDILVESHGLAFDLLVFGAIITYYEIKKYNEEKIINENKERQLRIERYKEEISDYKFWKSEESFYRTRGLIKRLVGLNAKELDLSHCFLNGDYSLSQYKDMVRWNFSAAYLENTFFLLSDMTSSYFYDTHLNNSKFNKVNLKNCAFDESHLLDTNFIECNLNGTSFLNAIVNDRNWFDTLERDKNEGVDELRKIYILEDYFELDDDFSKPEWYKIISR